MRIECVTPSREYTVWHNGDQVFFVPGERLNVLSLRISDGIEFLRVRCRGLEFEIPSYATTTVSMFELV
jgi:hypothetical protein